MSSTSPHSPSHQVSFVDFGDNTDLNQQNALTNPTHHHPPAAKAEADTTVAAVAFEAVEAVEAVVITSVVVGEATAAVGAMAVEVEAATTIAAEVKLNTAAPSVARMEIRKP